MRELSKSIIRFSWAMPLLGMNQMASLVAPGEGRRPLESASRTFDALSEVAAREMGSRFQELYDQGDRLQGRVVDGFFRLFEAGLQGRYSTEECCGDRR